MDELWAHAVIFISLMLITLVAMRIASRRRARREMISGVGRNRHDSTLT